MPSRQPSHHFGHSSDKRSSWPSPIDTTRCRLSIQQGGARTRHRSVGSGALPPGVLLSTVGVSCPRGWASDPPGEITVQRRIRRLMAGAVGALVIASCSSDDSTGDAGVDTTDVPVVETSVPLRGLSRRCRRKLRRQWPPTIRSSSSFSRRCPRASRRSTMNWATPGHQTWPRRSGTTVSRTPSRS